MAITSKQRKDFIDMLAPHVITVCKERGYGNAQAWTCIAQACCESAYGTSRLMKNANAFFGVKATKGWVSKAKYGGLVYNTKTKECYDGKTYVTITDCFRAYNNVEDCVRDYFDLLELPRYKASLTKDTVKDAITCIKKGGYATAPNYVTTICSFYKNNKDQIESYTVDGQTVQPTVTPTKTNEEIAKEVIKGKWGSGTARKEALRKAGYDPTAIQKIVNSLLR